tara:strand:+ start:1847 stop:2041 length:195 start_codon:yes stop_codon:yes gene_type:complete
MNIKDKKYLASRLELATNAIAMYDKLAIEDSKYDKDATFWRGYKNALELLGLNSRTNYKLANTL